MIKELEIHLPAAVHGWLMGTEYGLGVVHGYQWEDGDPEAPSADVLAVYEILHAANGTGGNADVRLSLTQLTSLRDEVFGCVAGHRADGELGAGLDEDEAAQMVAAIVTMAAANRLILNEVGTAATKPEDDAVAHVYTGTKVTLADGSVIDINTAESGTGRDLYLTCHGWWLMRDYSDTTESWTRVPLDAAMDWLWLNRGLDGGETFASDVAGTHALVRTLAGGEDMDDVLVFMDGTDMCPHLKGVWATCEPCGHEGMDADVIERLTPIRDAVHRVPAPTWLEVPCDVTPGEDTDAEPWQIKPMRAWIEEAQAKGIPVQQSGQYWPGCEMASYDPLRDVGGVVVGYRWYTLMFREGVVVARRLHAEVYESELPF